MRRILLPLVVLALAAAPVATALDRKQAQALVRIAVKASGLKARQQVRIVLERPAVFRRHRVKLLDRDYPRALQDYDETVLRALGLVNGPRGSLRTALLKLETRRAAYDPATRTAYVQTGAGERTAALPEVVHALQDQHYDLRRLLRLPGGSDARLAAAAAVEGHATLVSRVLAPRALASHGGPKLTRYLELRRGFVTDVGLRFASDLRNLGGRSALLGSLQRFPATSEQVFHLDKYLEREPARAIVLPVEAAGMTLVRDGSFGELDVRALLAVFGVPRLDHAAAGWGGGRTALYRRAGAEAVAVALDWDSERDALEWAEAVAVYVNESFDADTPGLLATVPCEATACWRTDARSIAFMSFGSRTVLVLGSDVTDAAALAAAVLGPE